MRIIAGKFKAKKLLQPASSDVRPTKDFVKETIFNMLTHLVDLEQPLHVLDLFAGSGSLALETISRWNASAVFVDNNMQSINTIVANLQSINQKNLHLVINHDATSVNLESLKVKFNIIFIDPPYNSNLVCESLSNIINQKLFQHNVLFVIETDRDLKIDFLHEISCKKIGITFLKIYNLQNNSL